MDKILNIIFNSILGLCPWLNVLTTFCKGLLEKKHKQTTISAIFLIAEALTLINIFSSEVSDSQFRFKVLTLMGIMLVAWLYTTSVFFKEKNNQAFKRLIVSIVTAVASFLLIAINILSTIIFIKQKKYVWIAPQLLILALSAIILLKIINIPLQFISLIILANFTFSTLWLFIEKDNWIKLNIYKTFFKNSSTNVNGQVSNPNNNDSNISSNNAFDKGWTKDDTLKLDVNLLTIEDIIYPIALKNEYEKTTRDLIERLRRITKQNSNNSSNVITKEDVYTSLRMYFEKTNLKSIRHVYIQSLYLLIEEYSKQDSRTSAYLNKLKSVEIV